MEYFESGDFCVTNGIKENLDINLEQLLFSLTLNLKLEKDYIQIFDLEKRGNLIKIKHSQEMPYYEKDYIYEHKLENDFEKIFIIDNGFQIIMMLSSEY